MMMGCGNRPIFGYFGPCFGWASAGLRLGPVWPFGLSRGLCYCWAFGYSSVWLFGQAKAGPRLGPVWLFGQATDGLRLGTMFRGYL